MAIVLISGHGWATVEPEPGLFQSPVGLQQAFLSNPTPIFHKLMRRIIAAAD
jgi:hypothetical protein